MANLGPQHINQSFGDLLQLPNGLTPVIQNVQDGSGNVTPLEISTTAVDLPIVGPDGSGMLSDLGGASGSNYIGFQQAGIGTVLRTSQDKQRETVSVLDFGAIGDGTTDDTVAIQKAIDAAILNQSTLVFTGGHYLISSSLNVTQPINIEGNRSQIYQQTANTNLFYLNGGGSGAGSIRNTGVIKDLILGTADGTGAAIHMKLWMNGTFENITVPYCGYGFRVEGCILNTFLNCRVSGGMVFSPGFFVTGLTHTCRKGWFVYGNLGGAVIQSNANTLIQCYVQNSTQHAYFFSGNNNNTLINCDSEGNDAASYHIYADTEINLNILSGDYEGINAIYLLNCVSPVIQGAFVNFQIYIGAGCVGAKVSSGLIKIITVASGAINTVIDQTTLYTGASGITDSGTNTKIGVVFNQQTNDPYYGGEWENNFTPIVSVGGTTTGHTITRADGYAKRIGRFLYIEVTITWSALAGSGAIDIDCSSIIPSVTGRQSLLNCYFDRVTLGVGYTTVFGLCQNTGVINILKGVSDKTLSAGTIPYSDTWPGNNELVLSGFVRLQ